MKKIIGLCALVFGVNTALAANTDQTLRQAVDYLKSGSAKEAYDLLVEHNNPSSTNPQEWFLLGVSAKKSGNLDDSARYFENVIALDSSASRAKLELADIAQRQGDSDKAKQLLLDVKADNPPPGVIATIDRLLANLAAREQQRKNWRIQASLGWMHDSNANAGPDVDSVLMYGVPFTLSADAKETSDTAVLTRLSLDYTKPVSNTLSWQSNLSVSWTDYNDLDNLDALSVSASTGAAWRQNGKMIWSLPIVADWVRLGYENSYYSSSYGIAPQLRYMANEKLSLSLATSFNEKKYQSSSDRDVTSWALSPSMDYKLSDKGSVRVGLSATTENSGLDYYSNDLMGMNASYFHNFSKELVVTTRASYSDSRYKGIEAAYTEKRHDNTTRVGIDITYHVEPIGSDLVLSVNHTNNTSNLPIYEHVRNQTSLSLRKSF